MSVTIFCVPYAGASARVYEPWRQAAGSAEVIRPLELPGRGVLGDTVARSVPEAARLVGSAVAEAVRPESRYVLFGHSLGAIIAFEVAAARQALRLPRPALVVISGRNAPSAPGEWARRMCELPDDELFTELKLNGGLAPGLSRSIAARFFLPQLRADLRMAADYRVAPDSRRIDVPLLVLHGRDDPLVQPRSAAAWAEFTNGPCTIETHDGGHFAILEKLPEVVRLIRCATKGV